MTREELSFIEWLIHQTTQTEHPSLAANGVELYDGKVWLYLPRLYAASWKRLPKGWNFTREDGPPKLHSCLERALPPPNLGLPSQALQERARALGLPPGDLLAFTPYRAPLVALAAFPREPGAIASYDDHWVRQALWALLDVNGPADPAASGVYVDRNTQLLVIHWPTRMHRYPFAKAPTIFRDAPDYLEQVIAARVARRSPQLMNADSASRVRRLFDRDPNIAPSLSDLDADGLFLLLHGSPWPLDTHACSILNYASFITRLDEYRPTTGQGGGKQRARVTRFDTIRLSDILLETDTPALLELGEELHRMEHQSGYPAVRIAVRAGSRRKWYLHVGGLFYEQLGNEQHLPEEVVLFDRHYRQHLKQTDYQIVDGRIFIAQPGLLRLHERGVVREQVFHALIAYHRKWERGYRPPLPAFTKTIEEREIIVNGRRRVTRGPRWSATEEQILVRWFTPGPEGHRALTDDDWNILLNQLGGIRSRNMVIAQLRKMNKRIQREEREKHGVHWKRYFKKVRLGEPIGRPRRQSPPTTPTALN
jgi:hypothetical protein